MTKPEHGNARLDMLGSLARLDKLCGDLHTKVLSLRNDLARQREPATLESTPHPNCQTEFDVWIAAIAISQNALEVAQAASHVTMAAGQVYQQCEMFQQNPPPGP